ncbi:MAG TPA: hypothetical protein DEO41_06550, partial [Betaproteobacteria bacterium]|nr:hypothetical protein [Betaproteobacteria bacterium]
MSRGIKNSRIKSGFLSVLIHAVLFLFLFISLDWNRRAPEPVMVELWSPELKSEVNTPQDTAKSESKTELKPEL